MLKSAQEILALIDLTSLNENDNDAVIAALCEKAVTPLGAVAAVCVYPQFVKLAKAHLINTSVNVATVMNFPAGNLPLSVVIAEIENALADGADEIDLVMPYSAYLKGERQYAIDFIASAKTASGSAKLKVILETGALATAEMISRASVDAINAGADFLKTSTGKHAVGASLPAVECMLNVIQSAKRAVGLKVAGGVRTYEQAVAYIQLAEKIMGNRWVTAEHFRIGASQLVQALLSSSEDANAVQSSTY